MTTRSLIGMGQGILMERLRITPDQAFGVLGRLSQERNEKLREVARRLGPSGVRSSSAVLAPHRTTVTRSPLSGK